MERNNPKVFVAGHRGLVGSAIVSKVAANLDLLKDEGGRDRIVAEVLELAGALAGSTHAARRGKVPA